MWEISAKETEVSVKAVEAIAVNIKVVPDVCFNRATAEFGSQFEKQVEMSVACLSNTHFHTARVLSECITHYY